MDEKVKKICEGISDAINYETHDVFFILEYLKSENTKNEIDFHDDKEVLDAIVGLNGKGDCYTCSIFVAKELEQKQVDFRVAYNDKHVFVCIETTTGLILMDNSRLAFPSPKFLPKNNYYEVLKGQQYFLYEYDKNILVQFDKKEIQSYYQLDTTNSYTSLLKGFRQDIEKSIPVQQKDTSLNGFDYDTFVSNLNDEEKQLITKCNLKEKIDEIKKCNDEIDKQIDLVRFRDLFIHKK
jgi:hypothetical protein